ncbi:transketolase family protein [Patescibacteria group bacterium]|nr:transketolase family protein [Patescibacteria group bacterium]
MLNSKLKLSNKIFTKDVVRVATRDGYGEGLVIVGEKDENVVVLCADLKDSTRSTAFAEKFPERFVEVGVAEQALVTIAAGMAAYGKIPFISSYAAFSPGRNWEQIRTTVAINDLPVKIAGAHAGISAGPDGATHQALEDIALMRVIPNMTVVVPCDAVETKKATIASVKNKKPTYIRFTKNQTPVITTEDTPFEIGKAEILWDSVSINSKSEYRNPKQIPNSNVQNSKPINQSANQPITNRVAIVACGPLVHEALLAAKKLEKEGVGSIVVNCHTVKPIDEKTIIEVAKKCGAVVTVEEHQVAGGLGGAIAEVLAKNHPAPMEFIGMPDSFGESGQPDELLEKYRMKSKHIIEVAEKVIRRKFSHT